MKNQGQESYQAPEVAIIEVMPEGGLAISGKGYGEQGAAGITLQEGTIIYEM